jgi:hypothetical protein
VYSSGLVVGFLGAMMPLTAVIGIVSVQHHRIQTLQRLHDSVLGWMASLGTNMVLEVPLLAAEHHRHRPLSNMSVDTSTDAVLALPIIELCTVKSVQAYIASRRLALLLFNQVVNLANLQPFFTLTMLICNMVVTIALVLVDTPPYNQPALRVYAGTARVIAVLKLCSFSVFMQA